MKKLMPLFTTLLLALAGAGLAQTTVTLWDFLAGGDGVRMGELVDGFNQSQDAVTIDRTTLEWGVPFYTKIRTSVVAGQQPDLMTYHLSRFPDAVDANLLCPVEDADLAGAGLASDQFLPLLVDKATIDGQLYGVPLDTHPMVLYYNVDLLEEAGLLGPDGAPEIASMDDFTTMLQAVHDETGDYGLSLELGGSMPWRLWYGLVEQQGGAVIEDGEVVFGAEGREALATMAGWAEAGLMPRNVDYPSSVAVFTGGQAAFMLNGVWEVPTLVDASASGELPFEFGVMPMPTFYDTPANWADSHAFAIPCSDRAGMDAETRAAAYEFLGYVAENAMVWASGGHIPAYLPVLNSDAYQGAEPNADFAVAGERVVYGPNATIAGAAGPLQDASTQYFVPAMNGQLDVERALEMFQQEIEGLLAQP